MTPPELEAFAQAVGQAQGLRDRLLEAFKTWAQDLGFNADKWTIDHNGNPITPLGESCTYYEAACSLQRIAEMAALSPETLVECFYYQARSGDPHEVPCQLSKSGQATLIVWAIWDGEKVVGEAREAMPAKPAVLVSLEGCGPEEGKWMDPVKLYSFMEYGFKLGRYAPPIKHALDADSEPADEQDILF